MPRKRRQKKAPTRNNLIRAVQELDPARLRTRVVQPRKGKGAKPESRVDFDWDEVSEWYNVT